MLVGHATWRQDRHSTKIKIIELGDTFLGGGGDWIPCLQDEVVFVVAFETHRYDCTHFCSNCTSCILKYH